MITKLINFFKQLISFEGKLQTNLFMVFLCYIFQCWNVHIIVKNGIEINNIYSLIFFSENFILIIACLLFNTLYKMTNVKNLAVNILENKYKIDIDGDNKLGGNSIEK